MGVFIIILSFLLIMMSFVLLIISPFAVIGVVFGIAGIIYGRYYNKHSAEIKGASKASFEKSKKQMSEIKKSMSEIKIQRKSNNHREQTSSEPVVRKISFVERIPVTGVSSESIDPFWIGENDIERENVIYYDRGEKIFRNVYSFDAAALEVSGSELLVNGESFGRLSPKNLKTYEYYISSYPDSWFSLDVSFGHYAEIVRNPDYDREFDDESERNMVVYDSLDKPRATLSIHYTTERSYS